MKCGFIALLFVFALASATHLPDCSRYGRFPPGDCVQAGSTLKDAKTFHALGPSGKYWLLALWSDECKTAADKETCVACNTMDVNTAWASTNATISCPQLCQNAASIIGAANCDGCPC